MLFSLQSWISMTLTFFLAAVVFHIVVKKSLDENRFGSSKEIVFYALTVSLNMGFHKVPKTTRLRTLIGSWMFYTLILAAIVQGKLFSFISKPPLEKPITNLEELAASDVPIKALEVTKRLFMFKDKTNDIILEKIEILEKVESLNIIAGYALKQNFATIVDDGVLILEPNFKKLMQYFTISNILMVFYMPFDHVLNEYFEKTLHRIVESGFFSQSISKWKHIYSLRSKIEEKEKTVFSIGVHQIESAFFVLAFGITSAFLTFILEHITHIFTSRLASKCDKTKTYTSLIYIE
nr:glutamate receptor 3.1-like [Leptinotarsa decemlineata]